MIDLVESSNPEHLESAGEALWKARDAIRRAAKELGDHIDRVDWHGESGDAFRDWGKGLVAHARKLSDFAETAGTQITVAGTGLASVRSAMPPRDSRQVCKSPDDIELPGRIDGNPEYAAAVEVEKNRQEAINQVNRLASYYSVAEEALAGQEPPRFEKQLDVDMPKPEHRKRVLPGSRSSSESSDALGGRDVSEPSARTVVGGRDTVPADSRPPVEVLFSATELDGTTSTEINSVKAPPSPTTVPSTTLAPLPTSTTGPREGPTVPLMTGLVNLVRGDSPRSPGLSGMPRSVGQTGVGMGKAQSTGGGPPVHGQAGSAVGRPGPMGGGASATGRPADGLQSPVAGHSGVIGGRPMGGAGGTAAAAGPHAGGGNGVVGGTPQRATPGHASGTGAARGASRGMVIGAPGKTHGRPSVGTSGQRGVIGGAGTDSRSGGRAAPAPSANGIIGAPRNASGSGTTPKGFTAGGAGLVRGPGGRTSAQDDEKNHGSSRPDYLTEDEETWNAGRRGALPPVVE